jgi:tetratricopeptide (TPR) repeat protein
VGAAQDQKVEEVHAFPQIDRILLSARQSGKKGDLREAETLYADARRQARSLNYAEGEARALTGLGTCQFESFSYRKALSSFLTARGLAASVDNPFLAGSISGNLASLYIELNSLPEAAEEIDKSIHFFDVAKDKPASQALLNAYVVKADLLYRQGKPAEGRTASEPAIALAQKLKDPRSEAFAWNRFAELIVFGKYDAPRSLYEEADQYLKNASRIEAETHDEESALATRMDKSLYHPLPRPTQTGARDHGRVVAGREFSAELRSPPDSGANPG